MWLINFRFIIHFFAISLSSFAINAADSLEYYSARPDILDVKSQEHADDKAWAKLKMGHLEAWAQISGLYPEHEKYFLARDMELLYDLARLLSHELGESLELKKIHLLNVSRLSKTSPHLKAYLEQEGLKEHDLAQGKKILLIDTGFMGSIPQAIKEQYPEHLRKSIDTHLMCSANDEHPSSRMFLKSLNPLADTVCPSTLHGSIIAYEHRPRYSQRADRYVEVGGTWIPAAPIDGSTSDGQVSKDEALKDMEDIKAFGLVAKNQQKFLRRKKIWLQLREHLLAQDKTSLIALFDAEPLKNHRIRSAMARDVVEVFATNLANSAFSLAVEELGLAAIVAPKVSGNKAEIMQENPRWQSLLADPSSGLEKLLKESDFATLRQLVDVVHDAEFDIVLAKKLGKYAAAPQMTQQLQEIAQAIIDNKDQEKREALIKHTFTHPNSAQWQAVLAELIASASWNECYWLVGVFEKGHTGAWEKQLNQLLIYAEDSKDFYACVLKNVFICDHAKNFGGALAKIIERHSSAIDFHSASYRFPQIALINFRPHINLLIRMGDQGVKWNIARFFVYDQSNDYGDELLTLISLGDNSVRAILAKNAFSPKLINSRKAALAFLIHKGDVQVHKELFTNVSFHTESQELKPLLLLLLIKADNAAWESWIKDLSAFSESKPAPRSGRRLVHEKPYHPYKSLIVKAYAMKDNTQREIFIREMLGPDIQAMVPSSCPKRGVSYSAKKYESLVKVQEKLTRKWAKNSHIKPDEILVIVDNDGTLTLPRQHESDKYEARDGALSLLEWLKQQGVHIIIASANQEFTKTLSKLSTIGALKILGITNPVSEPLLEKSDLELQEYYGKGRQQVAIEKFQHEQVVSIGRALEDYDFDRKAYVPMTLSEATKHAIKQIYLVDDSITIIQKFIKDLMEFAPCHLPQFETAHIYHMEKV